MISTKAQELARALVARSEKRTEVINARLQSNPAMLAAAQYNYVQAKKQVRLLQTR